MSGSTLRWSRWMRASYLAVMVWQLVWHALLPAPWGAHNPWLAVFALVPLLIPLFGMIRLTYRSMIWAGLLLTLYFTVAVMELWVNPPQRAAAVIQVLLTVFYLFAFRKRNQSLQQA